MDFRSMLKKKKYAKWGNDEEGPDWGDLKHNEKEEEPVLKEVKKVRFFSFLVSHYFFISLYE